MNALQQCMERHRAQAAQAFVLDEELGTHHGLSWPDFLLLDALDAAGGTLPSATLARTLSTAPARLVLQLLPLEKVGLVERTQAADGKRQVSLRASARRLLDEARETATLVCARLQA